VIRVRSGGSGPYSISGIRLHSASNGTPYDFMQEVQVENPGGGIRGGKIR